MQELKGGFKMAVFELKKIGLLSLAKSLPIVFAILGVSIGIFSFFIFPVDFAINFTTNTKFLSLIIFTIFYAVFMEAGILIVAMLYNCMSTITGGISVKINIIEE